MIRCNGCDHEFEYDVTAVPPVGHGHIEVVLNPKEPAVVKQTDYYCSMSCLRTYPEVEDREASE
jgi:hypothetical protein